MVMPTELCIRLAYAFTDGGTVRLHTADEQGRPHLIELVQHMQKTNRESEIPGRLYYDHVLVEVRSAVERSLLDLLKRAPFRPNQFPDSSLNAEDPGAQRNVDEMDVRVLVNVILSFVESDEYVRLAQRS